MAFRLPPKVQQQNTVTGDTGLIPCLTNIKKVGVVTTYGAKQTVVFYAGDNSRRFLSRGFRPLCAPGCTLTWHGFYNVDNATPMERQLFIDKVEQSFTKF